MKSTSFIAILLTLITLLLVTGAAALFLWQGQQDLQRDIQLQQSEIQGHTTTINDLQTTAAAREMALATSEAGLATRDSELLAGQSLLATRDAELAEALATPDVTPTTTPSEAPPADGPPPLEIIHPTEGAIFTTEANLQVVAIGYAPEGLARMELAVGERAPFEQTFEDGDTYFVFRRTVFNLQPGTLFITATITTIDDETETASVRVIVREAAEPQDGNTQGWRSAPVAARPN